MQLTGKRPLPVLAQAGLIHPHDDNALIRCKGAAQAEKQIHALIDEDRPQSTLHQQKKNE